MWIPPLPSDFVPLCGALVQGLGLLRREFVQALASLTVEMSARVRLHLSSSSDQSAELRWHELAMRQALERLQSMPATFLDQRLQVAELQRHWILADAYLRFHSRCAAVLPMSSPPPHTEATIGAWTCDPGVVHKLWFAGLPVWFVRPVSKIIDPKIRQVVSFRQPTGLCQEPLDNGEHLFRGLAGERHLAVMLNSGHTYRDISLNAVVCPDYRITASVSDQATGPIRGVGTLSSSHHEHGRSQASSSVHASYRRGRDKFAEVDHAWMPKALAGWRRAIDNLDRSGPPKPQVLRGYWIPEPALILGPQDPRRVERYIMNWLRIRQVWLYLLRIPNSTVFQVSPQNWRSFLNTLDDAKGPADTRSSQRAQVIRNLLSDSFPGHVFDTTTQAPIQWHHYNLTRVDNDIAPLVLWEMFELGFRYELLAVDQYLRPRRSRREEAIREDDLSQIFPSHTIRTLSFLPTEQSIGLFAPLPQRRVPALNAFRGILSYWPGCPPEIANAKPLLGSEAPEVIEAMEFTLASFYVTNFFDLFTRAPLLPHLLP
ncbi:hypothetical protein C8Q76DRAFT_595563, partial [Earliella scabrosa]